MKLRPDGSIEGVDVGQWIKPHEVRPDTFHFVDHDASPDEGTWVIQTGPGQLILKTADDSGFVHDEITIERQGTKIVKVSPVPDSGSD